MRSMLLVLAFSLSHTISAKADDDAKAIVEKAIKAHGGAEKLSKIKAQQWKGTGKMMMGGTAQPYACDYKVMAPDKVRFDMAMDAGGQKIALAVATNGQLAWEQSGDMLRDMAKDKQKEFHHTVYAMHLGRLLPLRESAYTLANAGLHKYGNQVLVGVKVSKPGQRDVTLYFDNKTFLLTKMISKVLDEFQNNKEVEQDVAYLNYRDKDGMKVFDKMVIVRDGKEFITEEFSEQKVVNDMDAKIFEKPKPAK
jgi:hypothetical protein